VITGASVPLLTLLMGWDAMPEVRVKRAGFVDLATIHLVKNKIQK
jgi:hypothetical protein